MSSPPREYSPIERRWRLGLTAVLALYGWFLLNVSVYIKDARAQELPLVGGGEHDWAILLGELGLLSRDQAIGGAVYLAGVLIYAIAIVAGWRLLNPGDVP